MLELDVSETSPFCVSKRGTRSPRDRHKNAGGRLNGMTTKTAQAGVCNVPNRTIFEGDNLDVMRRMNDGCVDLIYLDPPFKDTWDLTDVDEAWLNEMVNRSRNVELI